MPRTFTVLSLGLHAARTFAADGEVVATAVFETTFHLSITDIVGGAGRGTVCVGGAGMEEGPLNAVCGEIASGGWLEAGIATGMKGRIEAPRLRLGDAVFDLSAATTWVAPPWPRLPSPIALRGALQTLARVALTGGRVPTDGLAGVAFGDSVTTGLAGAVLRQALLATATLGDWLADALSGTGGGDASAGHSALAEAAIRAAHQLMGLGPGLTPAGDDLLAGLLIGLHASSEASVAARLGAIIRAAPADATTPLARAFLEAAIEGLPGDTHAAIVTAVLGGDAPSMPRLIERVDAIGHTSGWDMLAGAVLALAAVAAARAPMPGAGAVT